MFVYVSTSYVTNSQLIVTGTTIQSVHNIFAKVAHQTQSMLQIHYTFDENKGLKPDNTPT